MVVKIAADHGDNGETGKSPFIGRENEINEIVGDLKDNKSNRGTNLLLVGESGIGKSASLDEIHRRQRRGSKELVMLRETQPSTNNIGLRLIVFQLF